MSEDEGDYRKIDYNQFTVGANYSVRFKYVSGENTVITELLSVVDVDFNGDYLFTDGYFEAVNGASNTVTLKYVNVISLSNFEISFLVNGTPNFVAITLIDYYDRGNAVTVRYVEQSGTVGVCVNNGEVLSLDRSFGRHSLRYEKGGFIADSKTYSYEWDGLFASDKILLHITLEDVTFVDGLEIQSVNHQQLDVNTDIHKSNIFCPYDTDSVLDLNTVVTIACAQVTDALCPYLESGLTMWVVAPNGEYVTSLDGVLLDEECEAKEYQIRLETYGMYHVYYNYVDQYGNITRRALYFFVGENYWRYVNGVPTVWE